MQGNRNKKKKKRKHKRHRINTGAGPPKASGGKGWRKLVKKLEELEELEGDAEAEAAEDRARKGSFGQIHPTTQPPGHPATQLPGHPATYLPN